MAQSAIVETDKDDDGYWWGLMPSETATVIAYVGAFVGLVGGGIALFKSWKAWC